MKAKLGFLGAFILTALLASAQEVKTNYDKNFNYSQIKTFYVKIGTAWGNPPNEQYAKDAVARQLAAKGWTQVSDESAADALVVINGATESKHSLQTFYAGGFGAYSWGGTPGVVATKETQFKVGTAVVDIFDTKTKKLLFRGTGQDEISEKREANQEKIDNGVEKMFKDFPAR